MNENGINFYLVLVWDKWQNFREHCNEQPKKEPFGRCMWDERPTIKKDFMEMNVNGIKFCLVLVWDKWQNFRGQCNEQPSFVNLLFI